MKTDNLYRRLNISFCTIVLSLLLTGCAGTGTRDFSLIQPIVDDPDATAVVVLRQTGFSGSGALMDINLDGMTIATLGNQEMIAHLIEPGNHVIQAAFTGIGGIGVNDPVSTFEVDDGEKKYFIVQLRTGLITNTVTLIEVTRSGFFNPL